MSRRLLLVAAVTAGLSVAWVVVNEHAPDSRQATMPVPDWSANRRPDEFRHLYDYAGILTHFEEGVERYLTRISDDFSIEAVILTRPGIDQFQDIDRLTATVFSGWQLGKDFDGRAVLLVLVQDRQEVRMEIGYELEDVFTDTFVGHVEDKQLKPYFLNDDIGTGLVALMEELDRRAELKHQGGYTLESIARLDGEFLSGGGGAGRDLDAYARAADAARPAPAAGGRGASTPEEAWLSMLAKWAGRGSDLNIEVYTELTKMAMGQPDRPDPRTRDALPHWQNAEFKVLRDEDHAVIYFGFKKGWDNAPFLFCRDQQGWKFDIVHQRRLVVMGPRKSWFIEQGRYPYVALLQEVPQSTGKDLPLEFADLYRCTDDSAIAARIRSLSAQLEKVPDDYTAVRELLRWNVVTGRRPNHVQPLLKRAKALAPEDPLPFKYSAIYQVNTFFQYKTALGEIEGYLRRGGDPAFGYKFKGFLYYRLKEYERAAAALNEVLAVEADDTYALSLLARVHALRYLQLDKVDPRRERARKQAVAYLRRAQSTGSPDAGRVARVTRWMRSEKLL
jgi:hypothetical protein